MAKGPSSGKGKTRPTKPDAPGTIFNALRTKGFQIKMLAHAEAILLHDMGAAASEIEHVLGGLAIPIEELVRGGGGEGQATQRIRRALSELGWHKHNFEIKKIIDGEERESITHAIDHVKRFSGNTFALEIEWNNKDPFFDRDLENFKRLHADGAISIGCIITRGESLQDKMAAFIEAFAVDNGIDASEKLPEFCRPTARQRQMYDAAANRCGSFRKGWATVFVADKFGEATTHWRKLQDRVRRGVGNPCPLLLIGIPSSVVVP